MPSKYALSVSLTEHLCQFLNDQVAAGHYRTASEVVREALRLLEAEKSRTGAAPVQPASTPGTGGRRLTGKDRVVNGKKTANRSAA